ncbi:MAG: VWA domain-containing protein [Proteobacteria bacterium]|nr:VWA domain-containing protein [Pseudomonadota bacterium]
MSSSLRQQALLQNDRRGSYAVTFSIILPVLIGFVAMGVDWGAVAVARIQVQAAADSAAMAATTSLDDGDIAWDRAERYAASVTANGITPAVSDVRFGEWDHDAEFFDVNGDDVNAVRVVTEAQVPMYFTRLFGWDEVTVRGVAGAGLALPARAPDMVLVLDVTGSMSPYEIQQERFATEALIDCVAERSHPESRASIVLFGGVDYTQVGMVELGQDYGQLMAAAGTIQGCGRGTPCSNTNPASGYEAALSILEEADTPEDVGQVVILMSDGEPVPYPAICGRSYLRKARRGDFRFPLEERCEQVGGFRGVDPWALTTWASQAQDKAIEREVDTYSVFYGRNQRGSDFLEDYIRAGDGEHSIALASHQIDDAFTDICLEYTSSDAALIF